MFDCPKRLLPAVLLLCCAAAPPPPAAGVSLSDAWFAKVSSRPLAGYFSVTNHGDQPLLMTGWSSPDCRTLRFAEAASGPTETPLNTMTVPAHDKMVFARGGYHLVCDGPPATLDTMKSIAVTIHFRSGRTLTMPFEIRSIAAPGAQDQHARGGAGESAD